LYLLASGGAVDVLLSLPVELFVDSAAGLDSHEAELGTRGGILNALFDALIDSLDMLLDVVDALDGTNGLGEGVVCRGELARS
jgi:hypothetical protein